MAIYTDGIHLVSDESLDELHEFADKIGLKRHWFEGLRKGHPHYDLMRSKKQLATDEGAITVSSKEIVKICKKMAERNFGRNPSFKDEETNKNNNQDENS
jgi:hypothetical protein